MNVQAAYELAKERYAEIGIDTDKAMDEVAQIPVSIHCWQGDDVRGFENPEGELSGGIQTTGNYPGRARTIEELRADFNKMASMTPGKKRISLHAIYLDSPVKIPRNEIEPKHFESWVQWAKEYGYGIDFNPTCFGHPLADAGFTLSSPDPAIRQFWIEHCIACRKIGEYFGKELNDRCIQNIWVPDGIKDIPVDRYAVRARLKDSLDKVMAYPIDKNYDVESVESKLFGIGLESCTVGSSEFYLAYALKNDMLLTLDAGHFHPTEVISDKISAVMQFLPEMLLHVSRPVRWDSDHVIILDDELRAIAQEIVRYGFEKRIHIGLDYFDASINRVAAWTIGTRNMQKALLYAKLEPTAQLQKLEFEGDYTSRLALLEAYKTFPFGDVWDMYCEKSGVPVGTDMLKEVKKYEAEVTSKR
ncbi:MAG: L-rhamnose isomerase [Clostridiales bacterium]|nr:L-rhamnose isomerase [Clostridiales bacterium]